MKRLIAAVLTIFFVCSVFLIGAPLPVSAESLYVRKIVSVVYDDSGSMRNGMSPNWAYASYAMQAFCGLLNSDDQLFITYMSEVEKDPSHNPPSKDLSASAIQSSIDSIRDHYGASNTPYEAIDVAFNKLKSVKDSNPNTQYWLVVITDGDEFQKLPIGVGGTVSASELTSKLDSCASTKMPNNSLPQITYLAIGSNAIKPVEKPDNGVYVYQSSGSGDIVDVMSQIADKVSGRLRLSASDITKKSGNTIEIKSSVPLMNISVLVQNTGAKITGASYSGGAKLNISRSVSISSPDGISGFTPPKDPLSGTAFLINDSSSNIEKGSYTIQFSDDVSLDDIVVMFEPALELRMKILVNGEEVSVQNNQVLQNVSEGDEISVSCKIYEMGTDTEIDTGLLPSGTKYEISVAEGGKVVEQKSGKEMSLDYVLKFIETEVKASVTIPGVNSIEFTAKFEPSEYVYVPPIVYSITSEYGSDIKSVKFDTIASNKDLSIVFTVYQDGEVMTDPNAVKALNPVITASPQGNDGTVSYTNDGKIVFTPNAAGFSTSNDGSFDVEVTCTIDDGTSETATYKVLISDYQVIAVGTDQSIKKTGFYGNQVGVSFYITKDGEKLDKEAVEKYITVLLNDSQSDLLTNVAVSADGTITVTPYSSEEHKLSFWNWWINWAYYLGLNGDDVEVTLSHAYGSATASIDVVGEDVSYLIVNVFLPLTIEIILLTILITWIILVVTKPRYLESAVLYVGNIKYNKDSETHTLRNFSVVRLEKFNKVKKGNGRLKFKKTADVVTANGIQVRADKGGRIICEMLFPWYRGKVEPIDFDLSNLKTPADILDHISKKKSLEIKEFDTHETIEGDFARVLAPANAKFAKYIVVPDSGNGGVTTIEGRKVIKSGKLFIYING